jgi:hypothetical protein
MWLPTRQMTLIGVVVLVVLLLLIGKVEGLESSKTCSTALSVYDEVRKTYVTGDAPPLDAKLCKGRTLARGKNAEGNKQCWEAKDDGTWVLKTDDNDCTTWTKVVNWKSGKVRKGANGTESRPWKNVKGWKRKADMKFKGDGAYSWTGGKVANTTECADKCKPEEGCAGFLFKKSDNLCWGLTADRAKDGNFVEERGMYAFYKKDNPPGVAKVASSSSGKAKGSGKNETNVRGGTYFFKVKYGNNPNPEYTPFYYIKFNSVENKDGKGCENSDDNKRIIADRNSRGLSAQQASGDDASYFLWVLTSTGDGKWTIKNQAHMNANCGYDRLGPSRINCDKQGTGVVFNNASEWYLKSVGDGWKFLSAHCKEGDKAAWLYIGPNGADMTSETNATTIYLEKKV